MTGDAIDTPDHRWCSRGRTGTELQAFAIVVASDDEPARNEIAPRAALRGRPVVALARGAGLQLVLDAVYAEMGDEPEIAIEATEREMLIPFVTAGLGFTLVPAAFAHQRAGAGTRCRRLRNPPGVRDIGVTRQAGHDDPLAQSFVNLVELS